MWKKFKVILTKSLIKENNVSSSLCFLSIAMFSFVFGYYSWSLLFNKFRGLEVNDQKTEGQVLQSSTDKILYVASNGNDSNDGSLQSPWRTINYALPKLQVGETLFIRGGIYDEELIINPPNSGTEENPITVKAYPGEEVIWRTDQGLALHFENVQWWIVEDIIFEGPYHAIIELGSLGPSPEHIPMNYVSHITIRGCTFRDSTGMGVHLCYADNISIENCKFINLRSGQAGVDKNAVSVAKYGYNVVVRNCVFEDIGSDGVHLGAWGNDIGNILIDDNQFRISGTRGPVGENGIDVKGVQGPIVIRANTFQNFILGGSDSSNGEVPSTALILHHSWEGGPSAKNVTIEKNLFYDNATHLTITHYCEDITVKNNIFRDVSEIGDEAKAMVIYRVTNAQILHNTFFNNRYHIFGYSQNVTTGILKNNVFWQGGFYVPNPSDETWSWDADYNAWSNITGTLPTIFSGSHDVNTTDLQIDPDTYSLLAGSPLIDAGVDVGVYDDFIGNNRPQGTGYDIGAFEYSSSEPTPIPDNGILEFETEDMNLTSPMSTLNDSTASGSKYILTNIVEEGMATFTFNVMEAGEYRIEGKAIAPTLGNDSFYVSIDQAPVSEIDTWDVLYDIPVEDRSTTDWVWDDVTYRGTGTFDNPETDPRIFNLTEGTHTLYIQGREANTKLDSLRIITASDFDLDGNDVVDIQDIKLFLKNWHKDPIQYDGDFNKDGSINSLDFAKLILNLD